MVKIEQLRVVLGVALAVSAGGAWAGGESGFYIGGGIGSAAVEDKEADPIDTGKLSFDESDSAYKVFGGFNFGVVPLIDLAVEAGYVDFGKPAGKANGKDVNYDASGFDAFGVAGLNFGPLGIFAKLGMINWDVEKDLGGTQNSYSGTDAAYGIGARFELLSVRLRAEYEMFDVSDLDKLDMFSVSVTYTF
jgi:opacity protein-like surface antigen